MVDYVLHDREVPDSSPFKDTYFLKQETNTTFESVNNSIISPLQLPPFIIVDINLHTVSNNRVSRQHNHYGNSYIHKL